MTRVPELLREPPSGPVLVLAPHPDDEVLGCGGAIALHARRGDHVQVAVAFDGALGAARTGLTGEALIRLREAEARAAAAVLAGDLGEPESVAHEFWRLPEGHQPSEVDLAAGAARVTEALARHAPALVYLPWAGERHVDHRALALAACAALAALPVEERPEALGYEVWSPLELDVILDVTDVFRQKREALERHATQLVANDLVHCAVGLASFRAMHLGRDPRGRARYGEAFRRFDPATWWSDARRAEDPFGGAA